MKQRIYGSPFLLLLVLMTLACSSSEKKGYAGLGRESVDEKVLAKFAPPVLDPLLSQKVQSYLDIRAPGMGMLSPNKKTLFFTWRVTGTTQVWKVNQPKGFPVQMTGGEDSTSVVGIAPHGKWLVISRDRNGEENPGIYTQSVDGGPLQIVQHKTKVQSIFEFVSSDSKYIYYRANDTKPDSYTIYRYDVENKKSEEIFSRDGYWVVADFRGSEKLLLAKVLTNTASEFYDYDLKSKELTPVIGQGELEDYSVHYGPREGQYFVLTPKLGEYRRLYSWDLKNLKAISPSMKWDVSGIHIDHSRKHLVYEINEGGYTRIRALDANTLQALSLPTFPSSDHVIPGAMSMDGSHIMLGIETSKGPRTSYSYNFTTNQLTQWVLPSQPEVDTTQFVRASLENYTAKDGTKIPMFVRRPEKCLAKKLAKPCPVVVHFHGGPEAQTRAGFSVFAQMFVDEGIIFVEPNVRGSDGYGKTWIHSDNGPKRLDVIGDIQDAAIFIKKNWAVNGLEPKVGIMGWSYGGYSTLMAMTYFAGSYDAGVSLVGMSNLQTFLQNTAPYRRALRIPEYGDPEKDKEALMKLSAVSYLDRVKSPLMIIQGATDPRVPAGEAVQMQKALKSKGVDSPLIIFADEGHGAAKRSNKVLELGHALNFLRSNLL